MKTIIAGSREITDRELVFGLIGKIPWEITEVVCGGARGIDTLGREWAESRGIPVKMFPVSNADWKKHGKKAGHLQNGQMAEYGEALAAIWDGASPGTSNMINQAKARGLKVIVFRRFFTHRVGDRHPEERLRGMKCRPLRDSALKDGDETSVIHLENGSKIIVRKKDLQQI